MLPRPFCLALLALLLPSTAMAIDAAVPPLVAKGVDPLVNLNLTSLVSSEADFLGVFDDVTQLDTAPAGLTASCLASTSCLYKIAKAAGTDTVLAGQATLVGDNYQFKLVYYSASKNRILHTKSFKLPNSPAEIADGMGGPVREVVTGKAPAEPESTKLSGFQDVDLFADDDFETVAPIADDSSRRIQTPTGGGRQLDDLSFLDEEDDDHGAAAALAAENAARQRAEEDAARRAEEDAARQRAQDEAAARRAEEDAARQRAQDEADRQRAEAEIARRNAEAAARREAEAAARRQEEAKAAAAAEASRRASAAASADDEDDMDFENFQLSSSTTVVDAAKPAAPDDDLDFLADDTSSRAPSTSRSYDSSARSSYDDLDEPISSSRSNSSRSNNSRSSSSRSSSSSSSNSRHSVDRDSSDQAGVMLTGRLGYAPYQGLGFVTYGAEVAYLVSGGLAVAGGLDAYSVQRTIPPENLDPGESPKQWNTILPINLGLQYHVGDSVVRPYFGADLLIVPGIVRGSGSTALGGRGRVGANFFVADQVALNLNGAIGFLSGKDMPTIEDGMTTGGVASQVSVGTVLSF